MSRNLGMSGRSKSDGFVKSNVMWIRYNIDWYALAKSSCKKCYGRGYEGYEVQTKEEIAEGNEPDRIMCSCVANKWATMQDHERMKYATLKPNADELVNKAKEEISKVIEEVKNEQTVSVEN